ncbi:pentapeptide repeat-containing protein, partial [Microcystis aeruginosa BLCCF108]
MHNNSRRAFIIFEEKPDELNFAGQNLQNLSFKNKNLTGANFTGADIRGCSFEGSILENANFSLVKAGRSNQQLFYAILCIVTLIISSANIYFFGIEYVNNLVIFILLLIAAVWTNFTNLLSLILINLMVISTDKRIDSIKKSSNIQSTYRAYTDHFGNNFFWMPFWLVLMTLTGIESIRRFVYISTNGVIININTIFFLVLLGLFIFFLYRVVILAFLSPVGYSGTYFNKANLNHAIFNQANLKDCNFTHANLDNCNFERAIFIRSRFENTSLAYTNWEAAKFKGKLNHFSSYLINDKVRRLLITRSGRDSNFQEAYFEQVDLSNVDLSGSNLNKANFQNALLAGANLANAQALGTDFTGVIINKDTNFENLRIDSKTKFPDDFAEDILDKCSEDILDKCSIVEFRNFNFSGRNLQNLSFKDLDLTGADFSGADIRGCSFEGAILENANFSSVIAGLSRNQFLLLILSTVITIILTGSLELLAIDYVNSHFSVFLRQFTGMMAVPFIWLTHLVVGLIVVAIAAGINLLILFLLWRLKQNQSKSLEILNLNHFGDIEAVQIYKPFHTFILSLCWGLMTISAIGSLFFLINSYSYTTGNTINIIVLSLLLISFLFFLLLAIFATVTYTEIGFNGTSFNHTILNNSTFYQANLGLCYFVNANLDNCNFERANFTRVDFTDSSLIYTNWKGIKIGGFSEYYGYLKNDNIRQLVVTRNGRDKNYRGLDLTQLDLQGVDLSGADLRNADLSGSNLRNAKLNRANLQNAKVFGTDFSEAVISNCKLENLLIDDDTKFPDNVRIPHDDQTNNSVNLSNQVLDFSNRTLRNISYVGQNLEGANFSNSVIINCNFKDANLRKSNFLSATITVKSYSLIYHLTWLLYGAFIGIQTFFNHHFFALIFLILSIFIAPFITFFSYGRNTEFPLLYFILSAAIISNKCLYLVFNFQIQHLFSYIDSLLVIFCCVFFIFYVYKFLERIGGNLLFDSTNLDGANFSNSTLHNCDFRNATIDHIDWSDAKFINLTDGHIFQYKDKYCYVK